MFFKCKHPANWLHVEKDHTEDPTQYPEYSTVTYHLYCLKCNTPVKVEYVRYYKERENK